MLIVTASFDSNRAHHGCLVRQVRHVLQRARGGRLHDQGDQQLVPELPQPHLRHAAILPEPDPLLSYPEPDPLLSRPEPDPVLSVRNQIPY